MRVKNDVCIKMYQLANTMFLSNEEFGLLVRKVMIDDDVNNMRYENLDGSILSSYEEMEKAWEQKFEEMSAKSPIVSQAYNTLHGQTSQSRKAFNEKRKAIESKGQTAEVPAEVKTDPLKVPTPKKIETAEDDKGPFWLFGSDYDVENDEAAIRDEITADEWINDPNLTFDYQNGELFKWILKHKISKNMTACEVVREYLKSEYDYENL